MSIVTSTEVVRKTTPATTGRELIADRAIADEFTNMMSRRDRVKIGDTVSRHRNGRPYGLPLRVIESPVETDANSVVTCRQSGGEVLQFDVAALVVATRPLLVKYVIDGSWAILT